MPPITSWTGMRYEFQIEDYDIIENQIWVVGYYPYHPSRSYGYVLYSSDGGQTWEIQWKDKPVVYGGFYSFAVDFISEMEGWVGGKSGILYTNDGGKHWEFRKGPSSKYAMGWILKFRVIDPNHLWVELRNGERYESFDGGKSWK